jgi:hypothetical protein
LAFSFQFLSISFQNTFSQYIFFLNISTIKNFDRTIKRYSTANADPVFSAFPRQEVNLFRITSPRLFIAGLGGAKFLPRRDNLSVVGTSLF